MSNPTNTFELHIGSALLGILGYFIVMLVYTAINMYVWRKLDHPISAWLNLITMTALSGIYILYLTKHYDLHFSLRSNITTTGVCIAIACAISFYLLLDCFLDPLLARFFPQSEAAYQESLATLSKTPLVSFLQVCILAPFVEELLIRGFVLEGLQHTYGKLIALLISALLFAFLHFNMAQTLSALACGLILGVLYMSTGSLFSCMLAHFGYNTISYVITILPLFLK